jgi:hypothetical protein
MPGFLQNLLPGAVRFFAAPTRLQMARPILGVSQAEPLQLEPGSTPMEGERDAVLIISKLSWDEGSTWTFLEQGGKVVAKINDQEFWEKVHQRAVAFREGDSLKARLRGR